MAHEQRKLHFDTLCVHADAGVEPEVADISPPLHVSTTFKRGKQWVYSREDTPTRNRVRQLVSTCANGI